MFLAANNQAVEGDNQDSGVGLELLHVWGTLGIFTPSNGGSKQEDNQQAIDR